MNNVRGLINQRLDVAIYNEATGFMLTSADLAGNNPRRSRFDLPDNWEQGLQAGVFVPVELRQDDSFVARIVLGELNAQERSESLGEINWYLRVPSGKLVLATGVDYVYHDSRDVLDEYFVTIDIPPGDYQVNVHTLITSFNADDCLPLPLDAEDHEAPAVGDWWRRTRPGVDMPMWLQSALADGIYFDSPEFDNDWETWDGYYDAETDPQVDFIIQLLPLTELPTSAVHEAHWLVCNTVHLPEQCPQGLPAHNLWNPMLDAISELEALTPDGEDVLARVEQCHKSPLLPPLALPAGMLRQVFRLAVYANDSVDAELILHYPASPDLAAWQHFEFVDLNPDGTALHVNFEHCDERWELLKHLRDLEPVLSKLPDATHLELLTAAEVDEDTVDEAGLFRFAGCIEQGHWLLEAVYPALDSETLRDMLALSHAADTLEALPCNAAEAAIVLERSRRDPVLQELPIQFTNNELRMQPRPYLDLLAMHLFQVRYGERLPMYDEDEFNRDTHAQFEQLGESLGAIFTVPLTDKVVLEGISGRFSVPDLSQLPITTTRLERIHQEFMACDFHSIGILVADRFKDVLILGYADHHNSYGLILANALGTQARECYSVFDGGKSLTTSNRAELANVNQGYFHQTVEGEFADIVAAHHAALEAYAVQGWKVRPATPTLEALAHAMDEFIVRTLGITDL